MQRGVVKDSSPGFPWNMLGADNGAVLETNGAEVWAEVERRMTYQRDHADEITKMSPEELVKKGVCDPIKIFIKKEPHSLKKVVSGMYRIIASVSLVDQLVCRMISTRQNKVEIMNWTTCPSKPGMGLNDEGMQRIAATAQNILDHGSIMETDVSSWDWTVQDWELRMDAEARAKLCGAKEGSTVYKLLMVHAHVVSNSVYTDSDGNMFAQTVSGGQLSGDYNTSSTNSRMRVILSMVARHLVNPEYTEQFAKDLMISSMGDDTFEIWLEHIAKMMEELGHIVKNVHQRFSIKDLEFCSQKWLENHLAYPTTASKTFFRFLSHRVDDANYPEYLAQLMWYIRNMEPAEITEIREIAMARVERAINSSAA